MMGAEVRVGYVPANNAHRPPSEVAKERGALRAYGVHHGADVVHAQRRPGDSGIG
jgi:hypothetical protein